MKCERLVIGLTGPTGAGKSEVTALLRERDIPVIDTDCLAREVVRPGEACLEALVREFSPAILNPDGTLNRRALAAAAFATKEASARLNTITHPAILRRANKMLADFFAAGARIVVIDAPLLFESSMDETCDRTVAVVAPAALRRDRIIKRDNLTPEQAAARMNAQPDEAYYTTRANEVLRNDGDLAAFRTAVHGWITRLKDEV